MNNNEGSKFLLTVVTVVKDDPDGFQVTLDSLSGKSLDSIEFLVVDSSCDKREIPHLLAHSGISGALIRQEPQGIYQAMNLALDSATGEYIYFLNAGDAIHMAAAFNDLIATLRTNNPDWLYSQVAFVDSQKRVITPPAFNYDKELKARFSRGRFPPHQGTVVKTALAQQFDGFDTRFTLVADYHLMLKMAQRVKPVELPVVLSTFITDGISNRKWRESLREFHLARVDVYNLGSLASYKDSLRMRILLVKMYVFKGLSQIRARLSTR